jgi:hypothetical protein
MSSTFGGMARRNAVECVVSATRTGRASVRPATAECRNRPVVARRAGMPAGTVATPGEAFGRRAVRSGPIRARGRWCAGPCDGDFADHVPAGRLRSPRDAGFGREDRIVGFGRRRGRRAGCDVPASVAHVGSSGAAICHPTWAQVQVGGQAASDRVSRGDLSGGHQRVGKPARVTRRTESKSGPT